MTLYGLRKRLTRASHRDSDIDVVIVDHNNHVLLDPNYVTRKYDPVLDRYVLVIHADTETLHKYDSLYLSN